MSNEKQLKQQIHRLNEQLRRLEEEKQAQQHQSKKSLIEANAKLDFQTRKAQEYEEKYKETLRYKNQEESVKELDQKLTQKQNEILKLMRIDHQKSQEIQELLQSTEQLKNQNASLSSDLNQIKQAALNAIVDKDTTISQLTEKLEELQNSQNLHHLRVLMGELQERNHQLQQKSEISKSEYLNVLEGKEEEINQLQEKLSILKEKHQERITRFEQQVVDYEKHIEQINAQRDHQANFQEKYYYTEEKLRKTEKRMTELEQKGLEEKNQLLISIQKLQSQSENSKHLTEELKEAKKKLANFQNTTYNLKSELDQHKQKLQKVTLDQNRKEKQFQSQKKIITDNLAIKILEIQRLKAELDQKHIAKEPTLSKQKSSSSLVSPAKSSSEDSSGLIEKLKKQNKDLEEANELLKRKIQQQTKELQESRQKLLQARGSQSNLEASKLMVQIEDLTSYLKKVENDMLMKKITHAQDQNFWSIKERKYKKEIEELNKKYKKENSELLQRIDRMKRLIPKDKKTDYYQSGFK